MKLTEEAKEILQKLDLPIPEGEELPEDYFDKEFKPKYIAKKLIKEDKELVGALTGNVLGSVKQKIRKSLGLENETIPSEITTPEDLVEYGVKRFHEEREELKAKATHGNDKKLNDLIAQQEELLKKHKEKDTIIKSLQEENEKKENEYKGFVKQTRIGSALEQARSKVKISEEAKKDELKMRGFESLIKEKVAFDWDEKEGLILKDPKTGETLVGTGGYVKAEDFLASQAKELGILQMANGTGGTGVKTVTQTTQTQNHQQQNQNGQRQMAKPLTPMGG